MTEVDQLIERLRTRPNDAPMPTEHLLDEAADALTKLQARIAELEANAVPREPTIAMTETGYEEYMECLAQRDGTTAASTVQCIWRAMYDAALGGQHDAG